jgi:hypothetical protein
LQNEVLDRLAITAADGADDRDHRVVERSSDVRVLGVGRRGRLDGVGRVQRSVEGDPAHPRRGDHYFGSLPLSPCFASQGTEISTGSSPSSSASSSARRSSTEGAEAAARKAAAV